MEAKVGLEEIVYSEMPFRNGTMSSVRSKVVSFEFPAQSLEDGRPNPCQYASGAYSCTQPSDTRDVHIDSGPWLVT